MFKPVQGGGGVTILVIQSFQKIFGGYNSQFFAVSYPLVGSGSDKIIRIRIRNTSQIFLFLQRISSFLTASHLLTPTASGFQFYIFAGQLAVTCIPCEHIYTYSIHIEQLYICRVTVQQHYYIITHALVFKNIKGKYYKMRPIFQHKRTFPVLFCSKVLYIHFASYYVYECEHRPHVHILLIVVGIPHTHARCKV